MLVVIGAVCKIIVACCNICSGEPVGDNLPTTVPECKPGYFYSSLYLRCAPCTHCDHRHALMVSPCNSSADTVCLHCAETSQPGIADHPVCKRCPPCPAGEYLVGICTENTTTVCATCQYGSFNDEPSYLKQCWPCTECGNREMRQDCTASTDTKCGGCKKGYFDLPNRHKCIKCHACLPDQKIIEECKGGFAGKLCSPYVITRTEYVNFDGGGDETHESTSLTPNFTDENLNITKASNSPPENITAIATIVSVVLLAIVICGILAWREWKCGRKVRHRELLDDQTELNSAPAAEHSQDRDDDTFNSVTAESSAGEEHSASPRTRSKEKHLRSDTGRGEHNTGHTSPIYDWIPMISSNLRSDKTNNYVTWDFMKGSVSIGISEDDVAMKLKGFG